MSYRTIGFTYRVLRNGADFGRIYPVEGGWPTIRMDGAGEIKTSLSGTFLPPVAEVDWFRDEIAPEMILDGTRYPLGIFRPATVTPRDDGVGQSLAIEAYDRSWLARDSRTATRQYFAAGTNYAEAAASMLAASGIGTVSTVATDLTLAEAREDWEIGTSRLQIANELLSEIGYKGVWFDSSGIARIEPWETVTAENIRHTISDRDVKSLLLPGISRTTDIFNSPNVFVVICSNPDKADGMVATAENTALQSPLSIQRRGRRIVRVTRVNNIATQQELQAYADRQLTDSLISGEKIQVTTGLLPGFGVGEVTALQYGEIFAICRETAWTMSLQAGGGMTHTLERQVLNVEQ